MCRLKVSGEKMQFFMAKQCMNPYDLCSKAQISYQTYRRIIITGNCKIATIGKIASALKIEIKEILESI